MSKLIRLGMCLLLHALCMSTYSQTTPTGGQLLDLPNRFFAGINKKIDKLDKQLSRQTEKYLQRLNKQEAKLRRKLSRVDSAAARRLTSGSAEYNQLIAKMKSPDAVAGKLGGEYLPYIDSIQGSFSFLEKNIEGFNGANDIALKAKQSLAGMQQLQSKLKHAEQVKQFIRQRKQRLKEELSRYTELSSGLTKRFQDFNKEVYYYSQQVREYKEMLNDPDKLTKKALSMLNKLPAFQDFMKQHSQLSGLFGLPAGYGNVANLGGLQTRAQVQALIQNQLTSAGPGGQQILQQNLQTAQSELNRFKDKLKNLGNSSGDIDMPDFKPNNQRTKSFIERLEIGTNLQSTKSSYFFPTTTDLGLSVGYKLSDKSTIGIGGSYKVGWGKDIRNIVVTGQGAGLRSFLDVKLKGSFYASGGFEYNYQPVDTAGTGILNWTSSGLIGVSKIVSLKTKFFKKTKLQLLWDFMSYSKLPRTQAIKFRLGYNF